MVWMEIYHINNEILKKYYVNNFDNNFDFIFYCL